MFVKLDLFYNVSKSLLEPYSLEIKNLSTKSLHIYPVSYCSDCRFLDHYHIRDMCICINQDLEVTHVQLEAAAEEAVVEAAVVS